MVTQYSMDNHGEEKKILAVTDKLLPRADDGAAASQDGEADALAHIGWAHYLRIRSGQGTCKQKKISGTHSGRDYRNVFLLPI